VTVEVRALTETDDRTPFSSGDPALDLYFHRFAGQNQFRHHIGVTYIAAQDRSILGFVTVVAAQLDADDLPEGRKMPPYPLPVLRVGRLAVAEAARDQKIGALLLRFAVELAERMRDTVGCVGLVVDAKAGAVGFYEHYGFVTCGAEEGALAAVPRPTLMYLPLAAVPRRS
jgi:GNAT superfamily N-acetyltransferase